MERPLDIPDLFASSAAASSSSSSSSVSDRAHEGGVGGQRRRGRRRRLPPRACGAIAADADGRVYVVRDDGGISCGDIRDELLLDGKVRSMVILEHAMNF